MKAFHGPVARRNAPPAGTRPADFCHGKWAVMDWVGVWIERVRTALFGPLRTDNEKVTGLRSAGLGQSA